MVTGSTHVDVGQHQVENECACILPGQPGLNTTNATIHWDVRLKSALDGHPNGSVLWTTFVNCPQLSLVTQFFMCSIFFLVFSPFLSFFIFSCFQFFSPTNLNCQYDCYYYNLLCYVFHFWYGRQKLGKEF
jgi:hypothetical protein